MKSQNIILLVATLCTVIGAVHSIECYVCLYDLNHPDLSEAISDKECVEDDFDGEGEGVKTNTGFERCYTALAMNREGDIVSAHRGGGKATLSPFLALVAREEDDFVVKYCNEDLCNGAPSMITSLSLLVSGFLIVYSRNILFL